MSLVVAAPTGDVIPAKITQQPGGNYQLEYLSKFTGKIPYCCYYIIIFFTIGSIDPEVWKQKVKTILERLDVEAVTLNETFVQQNNIITLQNDRQTLKEEMSLSVVTRYWTDFTAQIVQKV